MATSALVAIVSTGGEPDTTFDFRIDANEAHSFDVWTRLSLE